jgi:hypothetical protein
VTFWGWGLGLALCPKMCDAGIENPKKNVWLNKSISPLNKAFLLKKSQKNETFFLKHIFYAKKMFSFSDTKG